MNDLTDKKSSRRKFLKTTAFTGVGSMTGAVILNGVSPAILPEKMDFEPNHSYWANALPPPNPPLQQDITVDVAIIGAGLSGLSAGYSEFPGYHQ